MVRGIRKPVRSPTGLRFIAANVLFSLALGSLSLLVASNVARVDRVKLATIGTLFATFFLFTSKLYLPGGAASFIFYADAIVQNTTLSSSSGAFQRDAGYPLLIILSGYPFLHSLILLLIIQAAFAVVLPLLIFESLRRLAPLIAFYVSLASMLALSPYLFIKMIHHDQSYIFFEMLTLCMTLVFVQTKQIRYLYLMAFAAMFTSVVRPAGNLLFPTLIVGSYLVTRGKFRHYFTCVALFAIALGAYGWHRHLIVDVKNVVGTPSYTGAQMFYNPYVNSLDYGVRLWPQTVGPNFAHVFNDLREALGENEAKFIQNSYVGADEAAAVFARENMLSFTPDQLIDRMIESPNYEYYSLLWAANYDDRIMLRAAWEIVRSHPSLVLRYTARNLLHFLFNPGYEHSRYNLDPFGPDDLAFVPSVEVVAPDAIVGMSPRAVREIRFINSVKQPWIAESLFGWLEELWLEHYQTYLALLSLFICVAWGATVAAFARHASALWSKSSGDASKKYFLFPNGLIPSIVLASLLLCYDALLTALFVEPDFRYRQLADCEAIVLAGLGVISLGSWLDVGLGSRLRGSLRAYSAKLARLLDEFDPCRRLTAIQLAIWTACLITACFAVWALFMVEHTA